MNLEKQQIGLSENPDRIIFRKEPFLMQAKLVGRSSLSEKEWVKLNSEKFREIISSNPNLLDKYREDPEATLIFIEQKLKGKEISN